MNEHRLIERMIILVSKESNRISETNNIDPAFIDVIRDFFRTYVDRCHHGKEEMILFRDLLKKQLSSEHKKLIDELIEEHVYARKIMDNIDNAKNHYFQDEEKASEDLSTFLKELTELYPDHIRKEDKQFFYPCMDYFTRQEQDNMLQEFWDFDKKIIHEKYEQIVETVERTRYKRLSKWSCTVCGYVYDPEKGDSQSRIVPGTPFEELPEEWHCPICDAPKSKFEKIE